MGGLFRHPFPPIVRWIVAPGFLTLAGALAGAAAGASEADAVLPLAAMGASWAAAAALPLSLTVRPWAAMLGAPLVGLLAIVSIAAALSAGPPGRILDELLRDPEAIAGIVAALQGLLVPHLLHLWRPSMPFGLTLAFHTAGGLISVLLLLVLENHGPSEQGQILLFGALVGASQMPALAAARAVAARLARPESSEV